MPETTFGFTFAFQPIVDVARGEVFSYEALVRGPQGEPAASILAKVTPRNQYAFDQACRVKALTLASTLAIRSRLNINFLPNAIYEPERCIQSTLKVAHELSFPIDKIVFEVSEIENVRDHAKLIAIFTEYQRLGFRTAIDDFGAGYAGLDLLGDFQPDYLKIDMKLIRHIYAARPKQIIVKSIVEMCRQLGVGVIAEGVESEMEWSWLRDIGIHLFQGYFFARPAFEAFPALAAAGFVA